MTERLMRPPLVVSNKPVMADLSNLVEVIEQVGIQDLVAEAAVEPLEVSVVGWFAGLNVAQLNTMLMAPAYEWFCR
jgi:sorbitol-specific phosphotransferase system component IIBC